MRREVFNAGVNDTQRADRIEGGSVEGIGGHSQARTSSSSRIRAMFCWQIQGAASCPTESPMVS